MNVCLEQLDKQIVQKQEEIDRCEEELISLIGENPYKAYSQEYYEKYLWQSDESRNLSNKIETLRGELRELRWKRSSVGYPKHPYDIMKGMIDELDEGISQLMSLRGKIREVMNEFR